MKDLMRMRTSVKELVELALNQQIKLEMVSSAKYLAMGGWCDRNGYDYSAGFFYAQSDEERKHGLRIFRYLTDQGGTAYSPEVAAVMQEFDSLKTVYELALEQEIAVTDAINRLMSVCQRESDFATEELMRWFVKEQFEEEYVARRCLELFEQFPASEIYKLDKALSEVTYGENPLE